ncbi:ABC transporter ATP-binding protein [Noviherbaspirillum pedocola]|uniref:ABC transporter ATP-binding protein n=1 Tax=Noviherbaspirillum pedocola TaxID=2801341 RepID=A0A934T463_9BURK|nr:ABC transporter ATP-binding protein [Noviherbaspirillum pedocola]MBK4738713.1 ABC transporter ATP-binding protein [Noviherbaspirillum pedocola]
MATHHNNDGDTPLLAIDGISVRFGGIVALDGVSFTVQPGQICALIGPNGAGKSTLFNCLSRIYPCGSGGIAFNGEALAKLPRYRMAGIGIGRTFQNLALFRSMTVRDNVLMGCHSRHHAGFFRAMFRLPGAERIESESARRTDELITFLDLEPVADRVVADLPFGTQKRVELGRALAAEPKLLLLDEPACGLNHEELHSLGELICAIRDRFGITVLLVEHHMSLVMGIADKVVVLNFGRKIAEGTPGEVRSHPEVIQAYLGGDHAQPA